MLDLLMAPAAAASVLAFVTTIHLGLAALRNHRRNSGTAGLSLALISLLLAATPWLLPSAIGLLAGLSAHAAWFVACERLAASAAGRAPSAVPAKSSVPAPRPAAARGAPRQWVNARVLAVVQETADIKTFRLARPEGFVFVPGQFLTVRLQLDAREHARCYSISSAPDTTGWLEISVRRQGLVSGALHAVVRPGATLAVMAPLGAFVYPAADDRPLLLLAGGIGITPLMSMVRHALAVEPTRPVALLYSARSDADFAFRDELRLLERRHPQFRVHLASSGTSDPAIYPGRIDRALLQSTVPDPAQSVACICGPGEMIEAMRSLLADLGVPGTQVRYEMFEAAVAASRGGAAGAQERSAHEDRYEEKAVYRMACAASRRTVPIAAGQTLLEAAEQARIDVASLCRAGICGTCRIQVTGGRVHCEAASLDPDDKARGYVLACVATTDSDCTVEV